MLSQRHIERLAGALLVAAFVAFGVHFVTLALGSLPATVLLVLLYGVLIFLSAVALYLTFRRHERTLALFGASGFTAHGLFVVLACCLILAQFELESEAETEAVVAAGRALELAMDNIRATAFVILGLGAVALGVLIAWSGAATRWVGWLGIVAGTLGSLGLLATMFNVVAGGPGTILMLTALLILLVFILVLGARLVAAPLGAPGRSEQP